MSCFKDMLVMTNVKPTKWSDEFDTFFFLINIFDTNKKMQVAETYFLLATVNKWQKKTLKSFVVQTQIKVPTA